MPTGEQRFRPHFDPNVPKSVQDGLRVAFDRLYQILDMMLPLSVYARGNNYAGMLEVTTDQNTIPGCQVSLPRRGWWTVTGTFTIHWEQDGDRTVTGTLVHQGTRQQATAVLRLVGLAALDAIVTISQTWRVLAESGDSVYLQVTKDKAVQLCEVDGENSSISATWEGPG